MLLELESKKEGDGADANAARCAADKARVRREAVELTVRTRRREHAGRIPAGAQVSRQPGPRGGSHCPRIAA